MELGLTLIELSGLELSKALVQIRKAGFLGSRYITWSLYNCCL